MINIEEYENQTIEPKDLGGVLITVKHDGEHVVSSTFTTKDTLLTIIKTVSAMSRDIWENYDIKEKS